MSGLSRYPGKVVCPPGQRGFKSHTLCQGRLTGLGSGLLRKQNDSKGSGFDSSAFLQKVIGDVAHQVEQQTENLCVVGSSPTVATSQLK